MSTPPSSPSTAQAPQTTSAHPPGKRTFARFLGGFGLSLIGDQIWFVALGWAATRLDSPLHASAVMACASIPRAALLLVGGSVADRYGPLKIALSSQALRLAVMAGATGALLLSGESALWLLITVAVVFGALDAAHMPAAASLPIHILSKQDLPKGQAAVQTLERTASVIGAPVGGFIVAYGGLTMATAVNTLLFTGALLILRTLTRRIPAAAAPEETSDEGTWRSVRSGLSYVARDHVLSRILLVITMLNLALAAPVNIGIALLASDRGWGATGFSTIVMTFAGGAICGALFQAALRSTPRAPAAIGLLWVAGSGLGIAALPLLPNLTTTASLAALLGFTTGPGSALLFGLIQARTQTNYVGRVMALATFSALGLTPISFTLFGVLTDITGLTTAFIICASTVLASITVAFANRVVRTATLDTSEPTTYRDRPSP